MITVSTLWALRVTQILAFIAAELVALLLFQKIYLRLKESYEASRREYYSARLMSYLCGESSWEVLRAESFLDQGVVLSLLLECAENMSGTIIERVRDASRQLGIEADLQKRLSSRRWWVRAEAAWRLSLVGTPASIPALLHTIEDPVREVWLMGIRALSTIQGDLALGPILEHFTDLSLWARLEMTEIVTRLGASSIPLLIKGLELPRSDARCLAMELLGHLRDERAIAALTPFLKSRIDEERIHCVKALSGYEDPRALDLLLPLLSDPAREVRRLVCRALGRRGDNAHVLLLVRQLMDGSKRVRAAAEESLLQLGHTGIQALEKARAA